MHRGSKQLKAAQQSMLVQSLSAGLQFVITG